MPTVLDLFCGAGGLSLGLSTAGFDIVGAVDSNTDSCITYKNSHSGSVKVHNGFVEDVDLSNYRGVDLVAGGPPCQPFSRGGKGLGNKDRRNGISTYLDVVGKLKPAVVLMENVPGLVFPRHRDYLSSIVSRFGSLGYKVSYDILNSADYGVPQNRRRLFFVAFKDSDSRYTFPSPEYGAGSQYPHLGVGRVVCAESPLGEVNVAKVVYVKSPGVGRTPYTRHLVNGPGRVLNLGRPCNTIVTKDRTHILDVDGTLEAYHKHLVAGGRPRSGEVEGVRRLTLDECARIQDFPSNVVFTGSRSSKFRQVGNSVPPLLARAVGTSILDQLFAGG